MSHRSTHLTQTHLTHLTLLTCTLCTIVVRSNYYAELPLLVYEY